MVGRMLFIGSTGTGAPNDPTESSAQPK
jgi:hypothetical protein